jgi:hypothetical protein
VLRIQQALSAGQTSSPPRNGLYFFSVYPTDKGEKLYIITATTILLPEEH